MDRDTAKNLKDMLKKEQDALSQHAGGKTPLFYTRMLVAMEIHRLDHNIKLVGDSQARIGVEDPSLVYLVSHDIGLKTISSAEEFLKRLITELEEIKNFLPPLPLTTLFIQRVIESMEEWIIDHRQRQYAETMLTVTEYPPASMPVLTEVDWMPVPHTKFYTEHLTSCVRDAIYKVIEENPEGASSNHVLEILQRNPTMQIDYKARCYVREMYFRVAFPLISSKPAAPDHDQGTSSGHQ